MANRGSVDKDSGLDGLAEEIRGNLCGWNDRRTGTTGEQERRAKLYAVCSEPSRAKEKGKMSKTRELHDKQWATSVTKTRPHPK